MIRAGQAGGVGTVSRKALGGWSGGKKSGEDDSMREGDVEKVRGVRGESGKLGSRAAKTKRLCTALTYPGASATTGFQPQAIGRHSQGSGGRGAVRARGERERRREAAAAAQWLWQWSLS